MNRIIPVVTCSVAAVFAAAGPGAAQMLDLQRVEAVADSIAQVQIEAGLAPGLSIAIARDGRVVYARGFGQADVEMGVAAGPETVYNIASVTKQFTAAAVMRLVERGTLSLDEPITTYLPEYPTQGHTVTLRHLLNHTSGIRSFTGVGEDRWERTFRLDLTYEEMIDHFAVLPFDFAPGEDYDYNNSGYYLLGEIIGRATGVPYAEFIEGDLLGPLDLDDVVYCGDRRIVPNRAEGYHREDGALTNAPYLSISTFSPATGGLCATVGGLVRWTSLLHAGRVVSPGSLREMITPTVVAGGDTVSYGYGLEIGDLAGHRKISHSGSRPGFSAYLSHYPDPGITIVLLANDLAISATAVERTLAKAALGVAFTDLPLTADERGRYEGTYTYTSEDNVRRIQVLDDGGRLTARIQGTTVPLLNQGGHAFMGDIDDDVRLVFHVEDGAAEAATLHIGDWEVLARRAPEIPDLPLSAADASRLAGEYVLQFQQETRAFRVFVEAGQLMADLEGARSVSRLLHQGDQVFVFELNPALRFVFPAGGAAESVTLHYGGREIEGARKP